ncbi:hypothetical protein OAG1_17720 [Agarivorans sp. OAG1]|nr:hypothetical protein OAG1_17720 [Agarivorans sp. OAG1]
MKLITRKLIFLLCTWPVFSFAEIISLNVSLSEDTTITSDSDLIIKDGVEIVTNGHALTIFVKDNLIIQGNASITSYQNANNPIAPSKAQKGSNGGAASGQGQPGKRGGNGISGAAGENGATPGGVSIFVVGDAQGSLRITNNGGNGGNGGEGGDGGNGGKGGQGHRAKPNWVLGVAAGCESGPGWGGVGGAGGNGGNGGDAGNGGDGGRIEFFVGGTAERLDLIAESRGGAKGNAGSGGEHGIGGHGGESGRGAAGCSGGHRPGKPGAIGSKGNPGRNGVEGTGGAILVRPEKLVEEAEND